MQDPPIQTTITAGRRASIGFIAIVSINMMLLGCVGNSTAEAADSANGKKTVRVLTIGNSFAENACKFLTQIAVDGNVELIIGKANLGGCTLERHATLAAQSQDDPANRPYSRRHESKSSKLSLQEYLTAERWDFVTLQQMSALSFRPETYHPHVDQLVALIRQRAPQAKILIHETWAYRPDSPLMKSWGITQHEMHRRLAGAYADVAKQFDARIIPVGTAFQKFRDTTGRQIVFHEPKFDYENPVFPNLPDQTNSLVVGWYWGQRDDKPTLQLDFKHANTMGCYLAGLVWYEALSGNDARKITYVPPGVDDSVGKELRELAHSVSVAESSTK